MVLQLGFFFFLEQRPRPGADEDMEREKEGGRKSAAFVGLFPSVLPVLDTLRYIGQSLA